MEYTSGMPDDRKTTLKGVATPEAMPYYGVSTTKIFCRPFCASKTPNPENIIYFHSAREAIDAGYRPCKRCRPDLPEYDPQREMADKARKICEEYFDRPAVLKSVFRDMGIGRAALARAFARYEQSSLSEYIISLRIERAKALLRGTERNVLNVAIASGFSSISNFYRHFSRAVKIAPRRYRKEGGI
jgi:AraC family transcriptional regulator, regulatory protein of adaptative response / methylphosphotriester-DNA alkyltransferase methyltransferase